MKENEICKRVVFQYPKIQRDGKVGGRMYLFVIDECIVFCNLFSVIKKLLGGSHSAAFIIHSCSMYPA